LCDSSNCLPNLAPSLYRFEDLAHVGFWKLWKLKSSASLLKTASVLRLAVIVVLCRNCLPVRVDGRTSPNCWRRSTASCRLEPARAAMMRMMMMMMTTMIRIRRMKFWPTQMKMRLLTLIRSPVTRENLMIPVMDMHLRQRKPKPRLLFRSKFYILLQGVSVAASPVLATIGMSVRPSVCHTLALSENDAS